jgi:thioredoxin 1
MLGSWQVWVAAMGGGLVGWGLGRMLFRRSGEGVSAGPGVMGFLFAIAAAAVVWVFFLPHELPEVGSALTTTEEFEAKVLQADRPVVVDFYADWCGPCRRMMPVLDRLEADYGDRIDFYRVDVDDAKALASGQNIGGIPTLLLISRGREVDRLAGAKGERRLREAFEALIETHRQAVPAG